MAVQLPAPLQYQFIPASQTNVPLGTPGGLGDYLHRILITVTAAAGATLTLNDGGTAIPLMLGTAGQPLGLRAVECGFVSKNGGFTITNGAGVTVMAVGIFSGV